MTFIQCDAVYVDPFGNKMRCDLMAGHEDWHECGFSSVVIWGHEEGKSVVIWGDEEDESILQDLSGQAGQ